VRLARIKQAQARQVALCAQRGLSRLLPVRVSVTAARWAFIKQSLVRQAAQVAAAVIIRPPLHPRRAAQCAPQGLFHQRARASARAVRQATTNQVPALRVVRAVQLELTLHQVDHRCQQAVRVVRRAPISRHQGQQIALPAPLDRTAVVMASQQRRARARLVHIQYPQQQGARTVRQVTLRPTLVHQAVWHVLLGPI